MNNINWRTVEQRRKEGESWNSISKVIDVTKTRLMRHARKRGMDMETYYSTKGKKICDNCRRYFFKSDLICNSKGQFCRECHKKLFRGKK